MAFRKRNVILIGGKYSGSMDRFLHDERANVRSMYYKDEIRGLFQLCVFEHCFAGMNSGGRKACCIRHYVPLFINELDVAVILAPLVHTL
jgi:hypothetical protein